MSGRDRQRSMNHNRTYTAALFILGTLAFLSACMLLFLTGASESGVVETNLPTWSLPWIAIMNFAYVLGIVVTLCARRLRPETGRTMSRILNWALLPALPGGTVVGLYGLLKADREIQ